MPPSLAIIIDAAHALRTQGDRDPAFAAANQEIEEAEALSWLRRAVRTTAMTATACAARDGRARRADVGASQARLYAIGQLYEMLPRLQVGAPPGVAARTLGAIRTTSFQEAPDALQDWLAASSAVLYIINTLRAQDLTASERVALIGFAATCARAGAEQLARETGTAQPTHWLRI